MVYAYIGLVIAVLFLLAWIGALIGLGIAAKEQVAPGFEPVPELDQVEELSADADAALEAARQAVDEADEAQKQVSVAELARFRAEHRYRQARRRAELESVNSPRRLIQRAALDAYQRGDLDASQLHALWRFTDATVTTADVDNDDDVREARDHLQRVEEQEARFREKAELAERTVRIMAEEKEHAREAVAAAVRQASVGLPGLFYAS